MEFGKKKRVGNFVVLKYKKGDTPVIRVSDAASVFAVELAMTHMMFAVIDSIKDDSAWEKLHYVFVMWFGTISIFDAQFAKDVYVLIDEFVKRRSNTEGMTDEEKKEEDALIAAEEQLAELNEQTDNNNGVQQNN